MNKYESSFENYGIGPYTTALNSLYFYGEANNMLENFKHKRKGASSLGNLQTFIFAILFLLINWLI